MPSRPLQETLTAERGLIFRITHRDNVPWILRNGLHSSRASVSDPDFVGIGNLELIQKRAEVVVPIPPAGTLGDYIPFYFTPYSPMLLNIMTGYGGITQRPNSEIVILASSLERVKAAGSAYVYTDRHAYLRAAQFFNDRGRLAEAVDFELLRSRDFRRNDPDRPDRHERYQAEALVRDHLPADALLGIVCYGSEARERLMSEISSAGLDFGVHVRKGWYF